MSLSKFLARQSGHPSGLFGKLVLPRIWNKRNTALNDLALTKLALSSQDRVLEIGFGGGHLLSRMAGVVTEGLVAGVDVSQAMVDFCRRQYQAQVKTGKVELKRALAESLPFPDNHFSKVCSVNSIFYWYNTPQVLSEIRRVLVDDGLLVLCFTCKTAMENKRFAQQNNVTLYTIDQVKHLLETAGFRQIQTTQANDKHRDFFCVVGNKD